MIPAHLFCAAFGLKCRPKREKFPSPDDWLRELQEKAREAAPPADEGWRDAEPGKRGVVTIRVPGLPDDDGRVDWTEHDVPYSRGRTLSGYLSELGLGHEQILHVISDGRIFRRADIVRVLLPETRIARIGRKILRREAPAIEMPVFDAVIPRAGQVISVIPTVDGKNASVILGVVGGIIGAVAGFYIGGPMGAVKGALEGYAIGSTVGALLTPSPVINRGTDGPSSFIWNGITNDDRAGVPEEILLGERLVAGGRISAFRRRGFYIPPNRDVPDPPPAPETPTQDGPTAPVDQAAYTPNEKLYLLIRMAGHQTWGPVGTIDPNLPADVVTNPPDVRINNQHYSNFPGVKVSWRNGATPQSVIPGFDVVANTYDVNVDVTALGANVSYTYTTISNQVDAFEALLNIAGLSHNTNSGAQDNWTRYRLEYRRNGTGDPWTNVDGSTPGYRELKDHTHALKPETRRVEKLPRAKYDIRITWLDAQFKDVAFDQWHVILSGVTEETQQSVSYDGKTILAIEGIATEQLNGAMPTVTAMWRGAIPQKWDGTQFLAPDWGVGSATPAGRNRGWLTLWILRNHELGCGEELPDSDINLNAWKTYAEKCDELETVTPKVGSPYTEVRSQLDLYINQQQNAIDLIQQLLGSARGAAYWSGTKISAGFDGPTTPTQLFGMGNTLEDSFKLSYRSERGQINTYDVTFENRAANFDTDTVTVCIRRDGTFCDESDLQAAGEVVRRRSLQLIGTTRLTEVVREGRYRLKQHYAIRTIGSLGAATDSMMAETFDVINVSHDLTQWGYSGRVEPNDNAPANIIQSMVMFDRLIPFDGVTQYGVIIRYAAGDAGGHELIEERVVADVAAPSDGSSYFGVTVTVPFTRVPQEGDVWAYGPVATKVKPFRILEITRDANMQREISLVEYDASIFVTDGPITITNYSDLPDFSQPPAPITDLTATYEIVTQNDRSKQTDVILQWARPKPQKKYGFYKGARIEYAFNASGPWSQLPSSDSNDFRWRNAPHGVTLYFRVTPYGVGGRYNFAGAATTSIFVPWYNTPAAPVTGFAGAFSGDSAVWTWADLGREYQYEVRDVDANWGNDSFPPLLKARATEFKINAPNFRTKTLYIRAFDAFANYSSASANAAATKAVPSPPPITPSNFIRSKEMIKLPVGAATDQDARGIYMWASQTQGFTPSPSTLVGQVVPPGGGDFIFKTTNALPWYFRFAVADAISDRRLDYSFSAEYSSSIYSITPVNPVVNDPIAVPLRRRAVSKASGGGDGAFGGATAQVIALYALTVTWTHADNVNNPPLSLTGFQVIVYDTGLGIGTPLFETMVSDPARRSVGFPADSFSDGTVPVTIKAAVRAIYTDGIQSALISSNGSVLLDPVAPHPDIPTVDSNLTWPYIENFVRAASLPTGMSVGAGISASSVDPSGSGVVSITNGGGSNAYLEWRLFEWGSTYLDLLRTYSGSIGIILSFRLQIPAGQGVLNIQASFDNGMGVVVTKSIDRWVDDGNFHTGWLSFQNNFTFVGSSIAKFRLLIGNANVGAVVKLDAISLGIAGYGAALDADVSRALKARDQFKKTGDGGMQMTAPVSQVALDGSRVFFGSNGIFFSRQNDPLMSPGYREGQRGELGPTNGVVWFRCHEPNDTTSYGYSDDKEQTSGNAERVKPPILSPAAVNKFAITVSKKGTNFIVAAPANYPVREWLEVTDFSHDIDRGHPWAMWGLLNYFVITGGLDDRYIDSGPWARSQSKKSALALKDNVNDLTYDGANHLTPDPATDAWYHGKGLVADTDANSIYFRTTIWISIAVPLATRADGSPYFVDLSFVTWRAEGTQDAGNNWMNLFSNVGEQNGKGGYSGGFVGPMFRIPCDGATHVLPVPLSNEAGSTHRIGQGATLFTPDQYKDQCYIVRWVGLRREPGAPSTIVPVVEIAKIEMDFFKKNGANTPAVIVTEGNRFTYVTYNEH